MPHIPISDLLQSLAEAKQQVEINGIYYHHSDENKHYRVISVGIDEETDKVIVTYQPLYVEEELLFHRKLEIWNKPENGKPRFTKVK